MKGITRVLSKVAVPTKEFYLMINRRVYPSADSTTGYSPILTTDGYAVSHYCLFNHHIIIWLAGGSSMDMCIYLLLFS